MKHAELMKMSITDIELDKGNPRIKHYLEYYENITSEMIAMALSDSSNGDASTTYRSLKESIKVSGGIIHPIIVNHEKSGCYTVIEGNTRLQIYREFKEKTKSQDWDSIPCLVYEDLSDFEKHEIRLQSHLVGPREWDPYSKAKYLFQLSEIECLPMNTIIDMCGGGKNEIQKSIDAYTDMEFIYKPYAQEHGYEFNTREFSKFREYQNASVKQSIIKKGYDEKQFSVWVAEGIIDNAQKVRLIPKILKDKETTNIFLRKGLLEAEKVLNSKDLENTDLSNYSYEILCKALNQKLLSFEYQEIINLANSDAYADKKDALESLMAQLAVVIEGVNTHKN